MDSGLLNLLNGGDSGSHKSVIRKKTPICSWEIDGRHESLRLPRGAAAAAAAAGAAPGHLSQPPLTHTTYTSTMRPMPIDQTELTRPTIRTVTDHTIRLQCNTKYSQYTLINRTVRFSFPSPHHYVVNMITALTYHVYLFYWKR